MKRFLSTIVASYIRHIAFVLGSETDRVHTTAEGHKITRKDARNRTRSTCIRNSKSSLDVTLLTTLNV